MQGGRCQPLYERWLALVEEKGNELAVRGDGVGNGMTFRDLHAVVGGMAKAEAVVRAEGNGLGFLLAVLQAWRDDAVLWPVEKGAGLAGFGSAGFPLEICHVKTTSGSTGRPRWVLFTAGQLLADAEQIMGTMGLRAEWPNVAVVSMAHSYGFSNLVLPLLLHGIPLVLAASPLPEAMRAALGMGEKFTLAAVPAMWRAWAGAGLVDGRIRLAISAGAPLGVELERRVFLASGVKIHNFYGSSECGGIAYDGTLVPRVEGALVGTALRGVTVAVDEGTGCLRVRSAAVANGYADEVGAGGETLGEGCFLTSDEARVVGEAVWLEGRAGEAINVAARKISPAAVEEKLRALAGVREVVVFGIPSADAVRVDEVVAGVRLLDGVTVEAVRVASAAALGAEERPRHWWVVPDLGADERGKISRAEWRERFLLRRVGEVLRV